MDIQPVLAHLQQHAMAYGAGAVVVLILVYLTRRWSRSIIFYADELSIYLGVMHALVGGIVRLAAWFKDQSSMKRAFDLKDLAPPDWTTPLLTFWDTQGYKPFWILYVEITFALVILYLMYRFRPIRIQRKRTPRYPVSGRGAMPNAAKASPRAYGRR